MRVEIFVSSFAIAGLNPTLDGIYGLASEAIPWVRQNLNVAWATFFRDCDFEEHISFQYLRSASLWRETGRGTVDADRARSSVGWNSRCGFFLLLSNGLQVQSDQQNE